MAGPEHEDGFLSRWSRRKAQARRPPPEAGPQPAPAIAPTGELPAGPVPQAEPSAGSVRRAEPLSAGAAEPPPTLADVARLTPQSDFSRFVGREVEPDVRNAALKKLFADPHFNVMDGLDVYIDDYSRSDPLPAAMLRKTAQAAFLGLSSPAPEQDSASRPEPADRGTIEAGPAGAGAQAPPAPEIATHEDADLQLQPHDAAGRPGAEPGPGADGGCER
jgi:hypothetical protein